MLDLSDPRSAPLVAAMLDSARDAVLLVTTSGQIRAANAAASALYGYERTALESLSVSALRAPDTLADIPSHIAAALEAGGALFETTHRRKDGTIFPVEVSARGVVEGGTRFIVSVVRDIGSRRQQLAALAESEERYRRLFEASPDGVVVLGPDGRIVSANTQQARMYRYGHADEMIGIDARILVAPSCRERASAILRRRLNGEEIPAVSYRLLRRDGTEFDGETTATILRDARGEPAGYVCVTRDTTERTRVEAARLAAERQFRDIFEGALEGIYRTTLDGRNLAANPALAAMLGFASGDEVSFQITDSAHQVWVDAGERAEFIARLRRDGVVRGHECRFKRKDGHVIWVSLNSRIVTGPDGEPLYTEGFVENISERKRTADALRLSEARLAQAVSLAELGIWDWDPHSDQTTWNDEMLKIYGVPREAFTGKGSDYIAATREDYREAQRSNIERAFATGVTEEQLARGNFTKPEVNELCVVRPDGTERFTLGCAVTVVDASGRVLRMLGVTRDVTERRAEAERRARLEAQVAEARRLESLGRLAGGVAHDFNNLLTVILGCAEMLEEELASALPACAEDAREIRAAGERARDLTRQLLAFARKQVITPVVLDLRSVVRGSEKMLRRVLGEEIGLEVRVGPVLCPVHCDPGQIEQVIMNLAVNAHDAMPQGGTLLLETSRGPCPGAALPAHEPRAEPSSPDAWVRLVVRDTGVGLTEEVKAHLFEPFFTTKAKGRGTGLGLATVDGIVAQSGGHIHVTSALGAGTTFAICLPATSEPIDDAAPRGRGALSFGSELVLVVEDEPRVRAITVRTLRAAGYEVLVAANGDEALAVGAETLARVRLLITDVVMPGRSGVEIAQELSRQNPRLRVLYVSGHPEDSLAHRGVLDPGVEFLAKPFTASSLLGCVRRVLDG
jgi:two-component system cell cycle sensor histidine kinase/response regulator CckA